MRESNDTQSDSLNEIKRLYKMCHGYTHGSTIHVKYPLLQYFEISMMIYYVVRNIDISDNEPNLAEIVDRDFAILKEQYRIRSTENFDLYYEFNNSK